MNRLYKGYAMTKPIRLAQAEDVAAVRDLIVDAYAHYVPRLGRAPAPMMADYAQLAAEGVLWVMTDGDALAGVIVLREMPDHILVSNVAVATSRQGCGLGRLLLEHAENLARHKGARQLRLHTHRLMHENIALYAKLGWEEYDRCEQDGFPRVFMRRQLTAS